MIITISELQEKAAELSGFVIANLKLEKSASEDLIISSGEENLVVCSCLKNEAASPLHFYVQALIASGLNRDYLDIFVHETHFKMQVINQEEFLNLYDEQSLSFSKKPHLELIGNFEQGLLVINDWNYISAIAEDHEKYIAFFWETTA